MPKVFLTDPADVTTRMHHCGAGLYWFYHKDSFPANQPLFYSQLVANAVASVEIWDPYFNVKASNREADIFSVVTKAVTVKLLTQKGLNRSSTYMTDVFNAIKMKAPAGLNLRFGLRVMDIGLTANANWLFHDRCLIIDRRDVYLVGGSVEFHVKAIDSTGIYKVENIDTASFIMSVFDAYWKQAASKEIPIQYL